MPGMCSGHFHQHHNPDALLILPAGPEHHESRYGDLCGMCGWEIQICTLTIVQGLPAGHSSRILGCLRHVPHMRHGSPPEQYGPGHLSSLHSGQARQQDRHESVRRLRTGHFHGSSIPNKLQVLRPGADHLGRRQDELCCLPGWQIQDERIPSMRPLPPWSRSRVGRPVRCLPHMCSRELCGT